MFHLECHDIKHGLITLAQGFTNELVEHLAELHRKENERWGLIVLMIIAINLITDRTNNY